MRLATITNWAYGTTVLLTLASGGAMLLASNAQERERAAVKQRYRLDQATAKLGAELLLLTERARRYASSADPADLRTYRREAAAEKAIEDRVRRHLQDLGASADELSALHQAVRYAATLRDKHAAALAAMAKGDAASARQILFGAEYELELERANALIERFQYRLDQRTDAEVAEAEAMARLWRSSSEVVLAATGALVLFVLYFVFRQRVLSPVVRLSDVVSRLAAQDYAIELPPYDQVDEIGDMTQAIRIFRENGIERQQLERERNADRTLRDVLSRMTQRMQGPDTIRDLTAVIERFLPEIAPGMAGRLYLIDPQRNAMVETGNWGEPRHSGPELSPVSCWALQRAAPHRPAGASIDMLCAHIGTEGGGEVDAICLPLIAQRETVGLLYLEAREAGAADAVGENYLKMLAENIGLALANLRLRDALRELALADPLTGLSNRRELEMVLARELREGERHGRSVSCLMVDVDHFKRFNDSFGHEAGDSVLRSVAAVLRTSVREKDFVFRYGGEEFLILMPGSTLTQAKARAEEVRARVAATRFVHVGLDVGQITVSVGASSAPGSCPFEGLVKSADAALYRAKAAGRNRVNTAADSGEAEEHFPAALSARS